uniref:EGF-like domain-containing protein n=1 Tax=Biomphalaria glabrata TaxID=6526 RepID=A0A2C9LLA3_BIOGL
MGFLTKFTVWFILWTRLKYLAAQCPVGWVGSKCQYMCHCERNSMCDSDGRCPTKCITGWFGPGCQYEDLVTVDGAQIFTSAGSGTTSWLTDRDVTTCNEDPGLDSITVQWDKPYPFTWLRIQAKNASNLQLHFVFTSSNISYSCVNQLLAIVDTLTVDYRCEVNNTITSLRVTGPGLNGLCSLYVSGDRNVALKQSTDQTGTYQESNFFYTSSLAVDGDTNAFFLQNKCTHTTQDSTLSVYPASWTLTLDTARLVSRITIYNRADCCSDRLESFKLELLDTNNHTVWTYEGPAKASLVYELNTLQEKPVKRIIILAIKNDTFFSYGYTYFVRSLCIWSLFAKNLGH